MLGFLYFCTMSQPLSKQEMHNLAMNHVGKDLESRGFEFVAINSKLKKHPQFVCIDKNSQYFFVIVRVVKLPDNPNNYDVVWMETFKTHAKIKMPKYCMLALELAIQKAMNCLSILMKNTLLNTMVFKSSKRTLIR